MNQTELETFLLLNELQDTNFFEVSMTKIYETNSNSTKTTQTTSPTDTRIYKKTHNFFNPSEKNSTTYKVKDMISNFLKFRDLNKEYYFFKDQNVHSCENFEFESEQPDTITACTLKERNVNSTFVIGFFNFSISNNTSEFRNCFYLDKFNDIFEIYDTYYNQKGALHFQKNMRDTNITTNFYAHMVKKNLIPVYHVDANSNDQSEGGFNIVIRRSVWAIILTGVITTVSFLALFFFAKSKKKVYVPQEGFDKIQDTE